MHPDIAIAIARDHWATLKNEADMERLARTARAPDARRGAWRHTPLGFMRRWHRVRRAPVICPAVGPPG